MRFGIYFNRKLVVFKNLINTHFLYWSLIEDLAGLFSAPQKNFLEKKWTIYL